MKNNEFQCDQCGGIFEIEESWTREDAIEEAKKNFGYFDEDMAKICDDCYKEISLPN